MKNAKCKMQNCFAFVILHFAFPLTLEAMKFGFVLPLGDARTAANLAREAEQCGAALEPPEAAFCFTCGARVPR